MSEYNIKTIIYTDVFGVFIAKEQMIFKRLHGINEDLVINHIWYITKRVAVAGTVQYVNLALAKAKPSAVEKENK